MRLSLGRPCKWLLGTVPTGGDEEFYQNKNSGDEKGTEWKLPTLKVCSITLGQAIIDTRLELSSYLPELVLGLFVLTALPALLFLLCITGTTFPRLPHPSLLDGFGQWEALAEDGGQEEGRSQGFLSLSVC